MLNLPRPGGAGQTRCQRLDHVIGRPVVVPAVGAAGVERTLDEALHLVDERLDVEGLFLLAKLHREQLGQRRIGLGERDESLDERGLRVLFEEIV